MIDLSEYAERAAIGCSQVSQQYVLVSPALNDNLSFTHVSSRKRIQLPRCCLAIQLEMLARRDA